MPCFRRALASLGAKRVRFFAGRVRSEAYYFSRGLAAALNQSPQVDNTSDFLQRVPHRKHPGILHLKRVTLPQAVVEGAQALVYRSNVTQLEDRTKDLSHYLWSRKRPAEDGDIRGRANELEKRLRLKMASSREPVLQDKNEEALEEELKRRVMAALRGKIYHWQQLMYDKELSVLYLAARFGSGYAAVMRAFHEIQKRVPDFAPKTLLDFGSGAGTVIWAAHECWGSSIREYMCVDSSAEMNEMSELLLRGGSNSQEKLIPGVHHRQFLPVSPKVRYDLIVSAYSLNELPSQRDRVQTIETLWRKTDGYLILIENGTKEGHHMLMEARDTILNDDDRSRQKARTGHVFAPCPHPLPCPLKAKKESVPCNFIQAFQPLPFSWNPTTMWEKFSFLIMRRGPKEDIEEWPRITLPVQRRPRHVHCHMCCSDGTLQHMVITAHKHGRDLYRCARNSEWGDRLPVIITSKDSASTPIDEQQGEDCVPVVQSADVHRA
ncbi:ribosome assembly protein METTL17, mitochondrial isoform X2 [Ambystoma mexicanum]|uniref:ribosome assembly protein METTL17, mitochondrial isoform X2 n=1 Tax=Ambystoma mexicanum TaxID=8296 RepID=UPI0037E90B17